MCLYPTLLINPKYKPNKKNGGKPPPLSDTRIKHIPAPCGRCKQCLKQTANSWRIRLLEEVNHDTNGQFVTLTFSNESILKLTSSLQNYSGYALDNAIATLAVRRFLERIRKITNKSIKHWLITELGHNGTENIHLHGILWTKMSKEKLQQLWQYGYIWAGYHNQPTYISSQTVNYIIKYITKTDLHHNQYKPKILTSKGIGNQYIKSNRNKRNQFKDTQTIETYKTHTGHETSLPTYYKNHTYSPEQKEQLWIQKIESNIRYLGKQKFNMLTQSKEYFAQLKRHQETNEKLGYGTNEINWNQKQYQEQLRNQKNEIRKLKALKAGQTKKIKKTKHQKPPAGFKQGDLDFKG